MIDDTNSLSTWFPEIADELDAPGLDPRRLPTSQHNIPRKQAAEADSKGMYATLPWRCRHGHGWEATILTASRAPAAASARPLGYRRSRSGWLLNSRDSSTSHLR
ncbi:hypothetical protein GCM10027072_64700 [Streptomyces bullii]